MTMLIYRGADGEITRTEGVYKFVSASGETTISGRSDRELEEADVEGDISVYAMLHVYNDKLSNK